jgi:LysM repeat protein
MSEPAPEPGGGTGSFFQKKFLGIPAIVWLGGAAILAYLYFRSQSGSSSSGTTATTPSNANSGTATTGDTTFPANASTNLTINSQYAQSGTSTSTSGTPAPRHATPNPQPTPKTKAPTKKATTTVKKPATEVTVGQWPGNSTGGLAQWNTTLWGIANHYGTTVEALLKLNPQIKNANLVYPGEKVKV